MHPPGPDTCHPVHDSTAFTLSALMSVGIVASYLPQVGRILYYRSSEGIDPTFLLLGATSAASSLLNILALSWASVRCCSFVAGSSCLESLMGVIQIALGWVCFVVVFILFLVYFPNAEKYVTSVPGQPPRSKPSKVWQHIKRAFRPANYSGREEFLTPSSEDSDFDFLATASYAAIERNHATTGRARSTTSPQWRLSVNYAILTFLHLAICSFVTFLLLGTLPKASEPPLPHTPDPIPGPHEEHRDARVVRLWATFLGILSSVLALFQYVPQIWTTWNRKLVGSLSIPMMCIQTPGSFVFVYSLVIRPGANWTTWAVYLTTGLLQGLLLAMCIAWTVRQNRLGIDAFGNALDRSAPETEGERQPLLR